MTQLERGDFNGDGKLDLLAVEYATGKLWLYPGNATGANIGDGAARVELGSGGWAKMTGLAAGDFNGDGRTDLAAIDSSTRMLWVYPNNGQLSSIANPLTRIEAGGGGWHVMNDPTSGDFNGDGKADLLVVDSTTGKLWVYPGTNQPAGLGNATTRVEAGGGGWTKMNDPSSGDFNGDGKADLLVVDTSTGKLWVYPGTNQPANLGNVTTRIEAGRGGWTKMYDLTGGDFNHDGRSDLVVVDDNSGELWLYPGTNQAANLGNPDTRILVGRAGW
ncbi:FG-GAP repeat domain-containing protein [Plantactinospora sp. WMMB782]|uniref:FG-GAP repeat domain-containing protein n=1 Tax=Plantactinospora sp. WMMB782 TaxID=3404121 RepID=UPI003B939CD7